MAVVEVTPEDLASCRWDIAKFARLLGVEPHPGQERMWDAALMRDSTEYRPYWLTISVSAGNRAGKTLWMAILVLHHCIFKLGMRPPSPTDPKELDQFNRAAYDWYHFGIQQETGELLWNAIVQLLEGTHEAQRRDGRSGCPLVESLGQIAKYDIKERGEYRWIIIDPVLGGAQVHFRTTAERAIGSLGKEMHGISFDECGFERNLPFIVDEVLHFRRLSTGGPLILISTPSQGFNDFADVWKRGDRDDPQAEYRKLSFRMSTRENIGFGLTKPDFDNMVRGYTPELIPQNIDGFFIQGAKAFFDSASVDRMFVKDLPETRPRRANGRYVQGVDPAAVYDSTWSIVLDATEDGRADGVRATRKQGKQKVVAVAAMVVATHHAYTGEGATCETAVDTTGMGGKVFKELLGDLHPMRAVEFGGVKSRKLKMLTDLKGLIEQGRLRFPRSGVWLELRRQLLAYMLDDRKIEQDAVMCLAVAVKQVMRQMANARDTQPFDFFVAPLDEEGALLEVLRNRDKPIDLRKHRTARRIARGTRLQSFSRI